MSTKDLINLGLYPDSGTGDSARRGGEKINNMFADIYANFGDNPVGQDPNGAYYGYRRTFQEYEFKVGELHPAGKFVNVQFAHPFSKSSNLITPDSEGWNNTSVSGTDSVPDIYKDSEWYFLSRGEQLILDLTNIKQGGNVHIVLPLGTTGDRIVIRDAYNSWRKKRINVWTTPFDFQSEAQVAEWYANTEHLQNSLTYPDSDWSSIVDETGAKYYVPFKQGSSLLQSSATYPKIFQPFTLTSGVSSCTIEDLSNGGQRLEVEFFHKGPTWADSDGVIQSGGWVMVRKVNLFDFVSRGLADLDSDIKYANTGRSNTSNSAPVTLSTALPYALTLQANTGAQIDRFPIRYTSGDNGFTTAKYIIQTRMTVDNTSSGLTEEIQSSELLVTVVNSTNEVFINEYSIITSINRVTYPVNDIIKYSAFIEDESATNTRKYVVIRAIIDAGGPAASRPVFITAHRTSVIE